MVGYGGFLYGFVWKGVRIDYVLLLVCMAHGVVEWFVPRLFYLSPKSSSR